MEATENNKNFFTLTVGTAVNDGRRLILWV